MKRIVAIALTVAAVAALAAFLLRSRMTPQIARPTMLAQEPAARQIVKSSGIFLPAIEQATVGQEREDNGLGMKFCWCPPGVFTMGSRPDERGRDPRQEAQVQVTHRRGFWLGRFEVTQAQWKTVMGLTLREQRAKDPTQPRPVGDGSTRDHVGEGPAHPIYFVSHEEAEEFCRKFTESERRSGRLSESVEYRLPTEAQWEYACRAGTKTAFAFGDTLAPEDANFDPTPIGRGQPKGTPLRETTPGGRYRANDWGLCDMHGNVWEWCRDGFAEVLPGGDDPYVATPPANEWVGRGGCWHNPAVFCRSGGKRMRGTAEQRGSGLGFRVARVPSGS